MYMRYEKIQEISHLVEKKNLELTSHFIQYYGVCV